MKKKTRTCSFRKDLSNMEFGYLKAIYYVPKGKWHCICRCGNEVDVDTRNLLSGHTKSCGCLLKETNSKNNTYDMTGYENSHIKVLERCGSDKNGMATWKCLCKYCNNVFIATGSAIRTEHIQSCGCMHHIAANEENICRILDENGIEYKRQYTFADLRGKSNRRLKFDFAVFNNGKLSHLIEQNGENHYRKRALVSFEYAKRKHRDELKEKYCKEHGIELRIVDKDNFTLNDLI